MDARAKTGVSIRSAAKRYGPVVALDDVSLDIAPGEFVSLLGPSGSGKTTLLGILGGFVQPSSGTVWVGERDITFAPPHKRNIGIVFQNYALFPHMTVGENVAFPLRARREPKSGWAKKVADALAMVELNGYESRNISQLSGGQRQRVALARAFVIRPRVLLFDEPLSNLDARLRIQMRHEIRELQKRLSITTLYVTHDQEEAMAVSDRIAVMSKGAIAQVGSAEDLYYRPGSEFVARFVGKVNLVPGHLVRVGERGAEVDVLGQRIPVRAVPAGLKGGDPVNVVLRPEAIGLEAAAGPRDDAEMHPATVTSRTFLGEKIEYLVECAGETLQIASQSSGTRAASLIEGQRVRLLFPENAALLPVGGP